MSATVMKYATLPTSVRTTSSTSRVGRRDEIELVVCRRGGRGNTFVVPEQAAEFLLDALEALEAGKRVVLLEDDTELSPNEIAEIVGMSRPLVVRRMDAGDIPFKLVGTHRRSLLRDVLAFKGRDSNQSKAMRALADDADELGRDYGI